jgi:hypothetical protein
MHWSGLTKDYPPWRKPFFAIRKDYKSLEFNFLLSPFFQGFWNSNENSSSSNFLQKPSENTRYRVFPGLVQWPTFVKSGGLDNTFYRLRFFKKEVLFDYGLQLINRCGISCTSFFAKVFVWLKQSPCPQKPFKKSSNPKIPLSISFVFGDTFFIDGCQKTNISIPHYNPRAKTSGFNNLISR